MTRDEHGGPAETELLEHRCITPEGRHRDAAGKAAGRALAIAVDARDFELAERATDVLASNDPPQESP